MAFNSRIFGKIALGRIQQALPVSDAEIATLKSKVATLETKVATLESQMATMLTHKHDYDDGGVAEVTGLPRQ